MTSTEVFDNLYKNIFLNKENEDVEDSLYPVFFIHSSFSFWDSVEINLNKYMQGEFLKVDFPENNTDFRLVEKANFVFSECEKKELYSRRTPCNYTFFVYYDGKNPEVFTWVKNVVSVLKYISDAQHGLVYNLSLMLTFSNTVDAENLTEQLKVLDVNKNNIQLYMLSYDALFVARKTLFIDSICGMVINQTVLKNKPESENRKREASHAIRNYADNMGDSLDERIKCDWHVLACSGFDKQSEYIKEYVKHLIANSINLTSEKAAVILKETFSSYMTSDFCAVLQSAVSYIPRVEKLAMPKNGVGSLSEYFRYLYGPTGVKIVDLTLKATLTKHSVAHNDILDVIRLMYKKFSVYADPDMKKTVDNEIKKRIEALNVDKVNVTGSIGRALQMPYDEAESGQIQNAVSNYVSMYEKLYRVDSEIHFWHNVNDKISGDEDLYAESCAKSAEAAAILRDIKDDIEDTAFKFDFTGCEFIVDSYLSGELAYRLSSADNTELVSKIHNAYDKIPDLPMKSVVLCRASDMLSISPMAGFYKEFSDVKIDCEAASFIGEEYIGEFLIFSNPGQRGE